MAIAYPVEVSMRKLLPLLAVVACSGGRGDAECDPSRPGPGSVRAKVLTCAEELPEGPHVAARVGDLVLENNAARFVIRTGDEGHALYGLAGGGLVDAVRWGIEGQRGTDPLREIAWTSSFWLHDAESIEIVAGGGDEARVRVSGGWRAFPTLDEVLATPEPSEVYTLDYVLRPDEARLDVVTSADGEVAGLADLVFATGDVRPWIPGEDPFELPQAGAIELFALEPLDEASAVAIGSPGTVRMLNIGPVLGVTHDAVPGEVVRTVSLGQDLAEAMAPFWETAQVDPPDGIDAVEYRDADGAPLTRCAGAERCHEPVAAASSVEVWRGDGNGDWGGPGQEGRPAPVFVDAEPDAPIRVVAEREVDGETDRRFFVADGEGTWWLPPGVWTLTASRGPHWSTATETLALDVDTVGSFRPSLVEEVPTTGWAAADLHLHTEASPDSGVRTTRRLLGARAEGLDYVVVTEHDFVRGEGEWAAPGGLVVVAGVEVSTMGLGHFNAWPMPVDPDRSGNGAVRWHGTDIAALEEAVPEGALLQCNHPRFVDGGYAALFDWIELDETTDPALIPCTLVELLNRETLGDTEVVLADWYGLLNRGIRLTATGVSDSHQTSDPEGGARTLVRVDGAVTAEAVHAALRDGAAIATTGPFLELDVDGVGIGGTASVAGDAATATATVSAPAWMGLGQLSIVVDGVEVATQDVEEAGATLSTTVPVAEEGSWVVAVHRDPWAVTNPVWVER